MHDDCLKINIPSEEDNGDDDEEEDIDVSILLAVLVCVLPFDTKLVLPNSVSVTSYGGLFLSSSLTPDKSIFVYSVLVLLYFCLVFCITLSKKNNKCKKLLNLQVAGH